MERPDRPCDDDCARRQVAAAECDCSRSEEIDYSDDDLIHPTCKKCGSSDLCGYDTIVAIAFLQGFTRNAAGELEPEWEGETDVIWDTQAPHDGARPYQCRDCGELHSLSDLVVPASA